MAVPSTLKPFIRHHRQPRMSITALAEYLILQPDKQEGILHDSKFASPPIVGSYGDAMRALRAYNSDPRRDKSTLLKAKAALRDKASSFGMKPKARDEAMRCAEAIELFELNENALGLRAMSLHEPPHFDGLNIEGVLVSIRPDVLVSAAGDRVGAGFLRLAKTPDPENCKLDATKLKRGEERREMARYMIAMLQILLDANGDLGKADRDLCFVADVRLGELVRAPDNHSARVRIVRAACRQIANLWDSVAPRSSILQ